MTCGCFWLMLNVQLAVRFVPIMHLHSACYGLGSAPAARAAFSLLVTSVLTVPASGPGGGDSVGVAHHRIVGFLTSAAR